jgi:hypothetical protein
MELSGELLILEEGRLVAQEGGASRPGGPRSAALPPA